VKLSRRDRVTARKMTQSRLPTFAAAASPPIYVSSASTTPFIGSGNSPRSPYKQGNSVKSFSLAENSILVAAETFFILNSLDLSGGAYCLAVAIALALDAKARVSPELSA